MHIGVDTQTLDIRAIEVTTNAIGDAPTLPDLLTQIPEGETILSVSGDGAYDTRDCHAAIVGAGLIRSSRFAAMAGHGPRTVPASRPATNAARDEAAWPGDLEEVEWLP